MHPKGGRDFLPEPFISPKNRGRNFSFPIRGTGNALLPFRCYGYGLGGLWNMSPFYLTLPGLGSQCLFLIPWQVGLILIDFHEILGDGPDKNGKGSFILLDGETFKPVGTWPATKNDEATYG